MAFITMPAKSLLRKLSTGLVLFLGFLGVFSVVSPKMTPNGLSLGLTEKDVAHADAPYAQGYYQPYAEGGYGNLGVSASDGDDDCGDGSSSDGSDDDG